MTTTKLPTTRYYGSKRKLIKLIWDEITALGLDFDSTLDIFGGTGIFSYYAKLNFKQTIYNDIFKFNSIIGQALIQNKSFDLTNEDISSLFVVRDGINYNSTVYKYFKDIYFTDDENKQIDIIVQNISLLDNEDKKASAYYLLFQSCIIKRPYNLFHRKNLYMRVNYSGGAFGNKVTWERSFDELFSRFASELRNFNFDNGRQNFSVNYSALNCPINADLVYIDPPYFQHKQSHVSYHKRYHFLEGLAHYESLEENINHSKANNEIGLNASSEFENKDKFITDLETLIKKHKESIIVISYRNNAYPSITQIECVLSAYKTNVKCVSLGNHGYALNKSNSENYEYLFIGY
jgi:adenine-specific DNA-methyltransferase